MEKNDIKMAQGRAYAVFLDLTVEKYIPMTYTAVSVDPMITAPHSPSNESGPKVDIMSSYIAIEAADDKGRVMIRGKRDTGIFNKSNTGARIFDKNTVIPLSENILIPTIKRHRFGIRAKEDLIPSVAPSMKAECPFFSLKIRTEKIRTIDGIISDEIKLKLFTAFTE